MIRIEIPAKLYDPFFFSDKEVEIDETLLEHVQIKNQFIHDIAYFTNVETVKPWEEPAYSIPLLLKEWHILQTEIRVLFEQRKNQATLELMRQGIGFLMEFIFWTNEVPTQKLENGSIKMLKLKPVNCLERIQFIMKRPNIYPSFMQLIELFEEHEKQFSKYQAIKRAKNKI